MIIHKSKKILKFMSSILIPITCCMLTAPLSYSAACSNEVNQIIKLYDLKPLEGEGGYFKQTYKLETSSNKIPDATAILFFLKVGDKSRMHKLSSDEIYHFYSGDPIRLLQLSPDGTSHVVILGNDILHGQQIQVIVPKGTWQGSSLIGGGCYALVGTTMTPGFDPTKIQFATRENLLKAYPSAGNIITQLTDNDMQSK